MPLPLWHQGNGERALAAAHALRASAVARDARADAARDIRDTVERLAQSRLRAQAARDSLLPLAIRIRTRSLTAYRRGEIGILPALDALHAERDVAQGVIDDLTTFQEALATWKSLTGE